MYEEKTVKEITDALKEAMKELDFEFPVNYKWEDEEGNKYSSWKIGKGLYTGDGGMELFRKAMIEQANKEQLEKK